AAPRPSLIFVFGFPCPCGLVALPRVPEAAESPAPLRSRIVYLPISPSEPSWHPFCLAHSIILSVKLLRVHQKYSSQNGTEPLSNTSKTAVARPSAAAKA